MLDSMQSLVIRPEKTEDRGAIRDVTFEAFKSMPFANGDEPEVIDRLRVANALIVSLVAELDDGIVGHIAFSPATAADGSGPWYALGPVSVLPSWQRQGIGSELIHEGLGELEHVGAIGCILTGNPDYYTRFGFKSSPGLAPDNEPAEYFMVKFLGTGLPEGRFRFHDAFYGAV